MLISVAAAAGWLWAAAAAAEGMGDRSYFVHLNERPHDSSSSFKADCMHKSRTSMLKSRTNMRCKLDDPWNQFTTFFKEIGGDFRFTFDFILYDKNFPYANENQLWYLIAFLKELRSLVPDPNNIGAKGDAGADELAAFRAELEARAAPVRAGLQALLERQRRALELARKYSSQRRRRGHAPSRHGKNTVLIKP